MSGTAKGLSKFRVAQNQSKACRRPTSGSLGVRVRATRHPALRVRRVVDVVDLVLDITQLAVHDGRDNTPRRRGPSSSLVLQYKLRSRLPLRQRRSDQSQRQAASIPLRRLRFSVSHWPSSSRSKSHRTVCPYSPFLSACFVLTGARRSEPWIRRWMYREKRNRKRGKRRSSVPQSSASVSSVPSGASSARPSPTRTLDPRQTRVFADPPGSAFACTVSGAYPARPENPRSYTTPIIANGSIPAPQMYSSSTQPVSPIDDDFRPHSAPADLLNSEPPNAQHLAVDADHLRSLCRSPSLGYIPSAFPYATESNGALQERDQNSHQQNAIAGTSFAASESQQGENRSTPALIPSSSTSTLPSVPSLDLLSTLDDPQSTDALAVDASQSNFAYLSQLLQEAEAAYTPLNCNQPQAYPQPDSVPPQTYTQVPTLQSSNQYRVPVAVKTSYENLVNPAYHPAIPTHPHPIVPIPAQPGQYNMINPYMRHPNATPNPYNASFAPSLQSHSTSVYPYANFVPGGGIIATGSTSFTVPLYPYGAGAGWTDQRLQAFTMGARRIHVAESPGKEASAPASQTGVYPVFCPQ